MESRLIRMSVLDDISNVALQTTYLGVSFTFYKDTKLSGSGCLHVVFELGILSEDSLSC